MNTYRIIYVEKVGRVEVGKSTLVTGKLEGNVKTKFLRRHKNCRVLSIK